LIRGSATQMPARCRRSGKTAEAMPKELAKRAGVDSK
jgi:hypothetical protein